ncbi:MAG TPA: DUF885 domain-containing protein, partial [Planctomycetota bacterium]|nr:DUF885 domain-containing protein [Planctomycetota bacterium]
EDEARRHDARRSWRQLIEDGRRRAPESHWLREAYVSEVERTRRFVVERKIAPIPAGERLEILDTPVFERALRPYAVYQAPAPFDAETAGVLYVTPIDIRRSKDEQAAQLGAHCTPALPILALHEGYPGHHLQLTHANRAGSRLRRIMHSDVLAEGWALYCEELMWEQGYFTADPLTRLFQLRDLLFRACRVVLDAALHSGRMTPAQAVDYLVEQAMLDPTLAASEVSRYCTTPTQPMSYLVGKLQILELRSEAQQKLGARFQLHDFHAALLASGTIPPALVREELWSRLGVA